MLLNMFASQSRTLRSIDATLSVYAVSLNKLLLEGAANSREAFLPQHMLLVMDERQTWRLLNDAIPGHHSVSAPGSTGLF